MASSVTLGIAGGLLAGKVLGILAFTWLAVRLGIGALPSGVTWKHVIGVASLCGMGFTVSLFISGIAFDDPALVDQAKIGGIRRVTPGRRRGIPVPPLDEYRALWLIVSRPKATNDTISMQEVASG